MVAVATALVLAAVFVVVPSVDPVVAPVTAALATAPTPMVTGSHLSVAVTWNGANISSASGPSSAFSLGKGQSATVEFTFVGGAASSVGNATLELTYLGVVLTTSRAQPRGLGGPPVTYEAWINWSFGPLYDALEGAFQLTASLLYTNGSTGWSASFYVFAKAPYLLESGAVVVFLVLAAAELYWGIASIRDARRGRKPSPPVTTPAAGGAPPGPGPSPPQGGPGPSLSPPPPPPTGPSGPGGAS